MIFLLRRPLALLSLVLLAVGALPGLASAQTVAWRPGLGWIIEGNGAPGVPPAEARKALELMNQAREAEDKGAYRSAIRGYTRVSKRYPASVYAPEALYRSAQLHLKRRNLPKAFESYDAIVRRYPQYPRFDTIIGEQYGIADNLLNQGHRSRILWVIPGFRNPERGTRYFEQVIFNAPYSDYAPLSLMNIARGHMRRGNADEAIDALDRMINSYPNSMLAPDAYLKLADAHADLVDGPQYDQGATRAAISYYEDFLILYPREPGVAHAEDGLAEMRDQLSASKMEMADFYYYRRSNWKAAQVLYNEAITLAPNSPSASVARKRLAEVEDKIEAGVTPRRRFLGIF
jgi:outer membrane protein assembly factor BamD